jgi:hypothetical protein
MGMSISRFTVDIAGATGRLRNAPKGQCHIAQGCGETATLGHGAMQYGINPNGVVSMEGR